MNEFEIRFLKESRWIYAWMAFAVGFLTGAAFVLTTGPYPKF